MSDLRIGSPTVLKIPGGVRGPQGLKGDKGDRGDKGDAGDVTPEATAAAAAAQAAKADAQVAAAAAAASAASVSIVAPPTGVAATDTANVLAAAALIRSAGGGTVEFRAPGTYLINQNLFVPRRSTIWIGPGVTLKQADGANIGILRNDAFSAARVNVTSFTAAQSVSGNVSVWLGTVVTDAAHGRAVGDYVSILGSTSYGYQGVYRIVSVTDATTLVVEMFTIPDAATATTRISATRIRVRSPGTGYAVGDTLTFVGGVVGTIAAVGTGGAIAVDTFLPATTAITVTNAGDLPIQAPANYLSALSTSGAGTGATFVIDWGTGATISATGMTLSLADDTITIEGEGTIDYNFAGNPAGTNTATIANFFAHVAHLRIGASLKVINGYKYAWCVFNGRDIGGDDQQYHTNSDGFHLQAPIFGCHLGTLTGRTDDDLFPLTGGDFVTYLPVANTYGDFENIVVDCLNPVNSLTAVKITGNAPYRVRSLKIGSIVGMVQNQVVYALNDGDSLRHTYIDDVEIGYINCLSQTKSEFVFVVNEVKRFVVKSMVRRAAPTGRQVAQFSQSTRVGNFSIDNIINGYPSPSYTVIQTYDYAIMEYVKIGGNLSFTGAGGVMQAAGAGYIGEIDIRGLKLTYSTNTMGRAINQLMPVARIQCDGLVMNGGSQLLNQSGLYTALGVRTDVLLGNAVMEGGYNCINAVGSVRVRGGGARLNATNIAFATNGLAGCSVDVAGDLENGSIRASGNTGASTMYINSPRVTNDVYNYQNGRLGDEVYNLNANFWPGVGPVIHDGTNWQRKVRGSQVYVIAATSFTPKWSNGLDLSATLTMNITAGVPQNIPPLGVRVTMVFTQDATGGWTITWTAANYKNAPTSDTGNVAGARRIISGISDGVVAISIDSDSGWF